MVHPPYEPPTDLPSFADPPVAEAVVGVEFEPLPGLGAAQLVALAARYLPAYPTLRELPGLPPSVGSGGQPLPQFAFVTGMPPLRLWLLSVDEQDLIQLQNDRVLLNWRAIQAGAKYPRYSSMRAEYLRVWEVFLDHLVANALPNVRPTYVESTFVNIYEITGDGPADSGLSFVSDLPESMPGTDSSFRFEISRTVQSESGLRGKVSVAGVPQEADDASRRYQLSITTKIQVNGDPHGEGLVRAIDMAHDLSVQAFGAATDPEHHDQWHREA